MTPCREAKEEFFSFFDFDETAVLSKVYIVRSKVRDKELRVDIKLDAPTMRKLLNRPLQALQGKGWESRFRETLKDVHSYISTRGLAIRVVVLTGGATKMTFIETITKEVFTEAHVTCDSEPSTCIALGLARWGRIDIRGSYFIDLRREN